MGVFKIIIIIAKCPVVISRKLKKKISLLLTGPVESTRHARKHALRSRAERESAGVWGCDIIGVQDGGLGSTGELKA